MVNERIFSLQTGTNSLLFLLLLLHKSKDLKEKNLIFLYIFLMVLAIVRHKYNSISIIEMHIICSEIRKMDTYHRVFTGQ